MRSRQRTIPRQQYPHGGRAGLPAVVRAAGGLTADDPAARAARLELLLAATGSGGFDWDLAAGTLDWDDRACRILGIVPEEFDRQRGTFFDLVLPEDGPRVADALAEAVARSGEYAVEFRVRRRDGAVRRVAACGRVLPGPGGRPGRLVGVVRDLAGGLPDAPAADAPGAALPGAAGPERGSGGSLPPSVRRGPPERRAPSRRLTRAVEPGDLAGVGRVRRQLGSALRRWGAAELADSAELLAAELLTNALVHTGRGAVLTAVLTGAPGGPGAPGRDGAASDVLAAPGPAAGTPDQACGAGVRPAAGRLRVEVHDRAPELPRPRLPDDRACSGRGLLLVEALAADWGVRPCREGKATWFELLAECGPQAAPVPR